MPISDERKEQKKEQIDWGIKINKFEQSQVNSSLQHLIFNNPVEKIPPWYCEVLKMVLFACSYAYREAFGWDNLTARMYQELALKLPKMEDINEPTELEKQNKKLKEFVGYFPGEFQEAYVINGVFKTGEDKTMKNDEFVALWKFMESEPFDRFTMEVITKYFYKNK